jgi:isopentenyl-diphosphate Delta-isomerase
MDEQLILVDENDNETGSLDKLSVHQKGLLHRAFSVFIFNTKGEVLLQQRADGKYHSAGLWSNTCCSHPRKSEKLKEAISRRLLEEMGIDCETQFKFTFTYRCEFENGLTEHELDHVYFGTSDMLPVTDPQEVKDWRYIRLENLVEEIAKTPEQFSEWLKLCLPRVIKARQAKM